MTVHFRTAAVKNQNALMDSTCRLFARIDQWALDGENWHAMHWIEAGLDVSFNADSVNEYAYLSRLDESELDDYIDKECHFETVSINMDW